MAEKKGGDTYETDHENESADGRAVSCPVSGPV
jgi:hypothetical protein